MINLIVSRHNSRFTKVFRMISAPVNTGEARHRKALSRFQEATMGSSEAMGCVANVSRMLDICYIQGIDKVCKYIGSTEIFWM